MEDTVTETNHYTTESGTREERAQAKGAGAWEVRAGFLGEALEPVLKDQENPARSKEAGAGLLRYPLLSLKHSLYFQDRLPSWIPQCL